MPPPSEVIDITGYPLIPIEKKGDGRYVYPCVRYGMLPYYKNLIGEIVWGCIETNRFEPITIEPAAGKQDIIAIKNDQRLVLELGKPLPDKSRDFNFLKPFIGQIFRDEAAYQDIIACLITNGFNVYLENPLATAVHEVYEEHGIDLRKTIGCDHYLLKVPLELLQFQLIPAQNGVAALGIWLPELASIEEINLRYTKKIDNKVRRNFGREFYEKGSWVTLVEFKTRFMQEKEKFSCLDDYTLVKVELINWAFKAYEVNMQFLERTERSLLSQTQLESPTIIVSAPLIFATAPIQGTTVSSCSSTFFNQPQPIANLQASPVALPHRPTQLETHASF